MVAGDNLEKSALSDAVPVYHVMIHADQMQSVRADVNSANYPALFVFFRDDEFPLIIAQFLRQADVNCELHTAHNGVNMDIPRGRILLGRECAGSTIHLQQARYHIHRTFSGSITRLLLARRLVRRNSQRQPCLIHLQVKRQHLHLIRTRPGLAGEPFPDSLMAHIQLLFHPCLPTLSVGRYMRVTIASGIEPLRKCLIAQLSDLSTNWDSFN